jgi:hypothetical protein
MMSQSLTGLLVHTTTLSALITCPSLVVMRAGTPSSIFSAWTPE